MSSCTIKAEDSERIDAQSDISMMVARKNQLQTSNREGLTMLERSRLMQERTLALRRHDYVEVEGIDARDIINFLANFITQIGRPVTYTLAKDLFQRIRGTLATRFRWPS
jgi:hypothetical protein